MEWKRVYGSRNESITKPDHVNGDKADQLKSHIMNGVLQGFTMKILGGDERNNCDSESERWSQNKMILIMSTSESDHVRVSIYKIQQQQPVKSYLR